ncbi:MAG: hypothetical protein KGI29_01560 [Pseudomonadota bacterium]|nr:hypothetical protein [Pseudomonadota bacterium]MDE3038115.1 hypothetical protein [Pseudomonadota bacterium]
MNNTIQNRWLLPATIVAVVLYAFYFYPYFVDDGYISLRYAQRLIHGHGLTWNDGEYVEGYSNLLWVLLTAALGYIGFDLPASARALGLACTLLTPLALFYHARQARLPLMALMAGLAIYVCTPAVAIWAMAGMETPLLMLLLSWAIVLTCGLLTASDGRTSSVIGLLLGFICLLRPEGPVYAIVTAAAFLLHADVPVPSRLRTIAHIAAVASPFFLGQLAFRLYYYGEFVSNTVLVKVGVSETHLLQGVLYTANALLTLLPLILYGVINLYRSACRKEREFYERSGLFAATIFFFLTVAVTISGGDIFPGLRAFAPLIPLLALIFMDSVTAGLRLTGLKTEACFLAALGLSYIWLQASVEINQRPKYSLWEMDAKAMGEALKQRYAAGHPLIAVYTAGAIPFYSGLPAIDVYGLNDRYLAETRAANPYFDTGLIGHELFDAAYVESRKPDILVFDVPGLMPLCSLKKYREGCDELLAHYRRTMLNIPGHSVPIWLRKGSDKVK